MDDSEFASDVAERVERELQLVARMRGGDDRADARLVARHGREADALREHARARTADPTAPSRATPSPTITGVIGLSLIPVLNPSSFRPALKNRVLSHSRSMSCRFFHEHVDRGDAGGGDRRRMRRREQERPRAVVQEVDERARAGDIAAERADRLRQRSDLDVDPAVHAEMVDRAAAVAAEHAARMRVVDHHDASEFLGERAQIGQRPEVAVHAEHAVGNEQFALARPAASAGSCGRRRRPCAGTL